MIIDINTAVPQHSIPKSPKLDPFEEKDKSQTENQSTQSERKS
jgi:hypothetical protein